MKNEHVQQCFEYSPASPRDLTEFVLTLMALAKLTTSPSPPPPPPGPPEAAAACRLLSLRRTLGRRMLRGMSTSIDTKLSESLQIIYYFDKQQRTRANR